MAEAMESSYTLSVDTLVKEGDGSDALGDAQKSQICREVVAKRNWQIDRKTLTDCMLEVYKNNLWTDIIIYCGTNQEQSLKAHKIILAARSPVFEAMLFGPCSEQKNEYTFPDINIETFDNLLRYLYHDDVEFSDIEEAIDLIQTAHMYQITSLVDFCGNYLQTQITLDNSCKILDVAMKYDKTDLRDACCSFIDRNADAVLESGEVLKISPEGLKYILKGDTFWAKEDVIFHRVEDWARRRLTETGLEENGQTIRDTYGDIMYHVRLPTLPIKNIYRCIRRKGYFTFSEFEDILDCNLGDQSHLNLISNNPRIGPDQRLNLINDGNNELLKRTNLHQILAVHVSRTVHLKSLGIPRMALFVKCPTTKPYVAQMGSCLFGSTPSQNLSEEKKIPENFTSTLNVTIKVDQVGFKECFLVEQMSEVSELTLTKPLLLGKQKTPYILEVDIKPKDGSNSIMLEGRNGTIRKVFALWGSKPYIFISQGNSSMLGIEWIDLINGSHRDNDDSTNEWSELDLK